MKQVNRSILIEAINSKIIYVTKISQKQLLALECLGFVVFLIK